MQAIKTKADYQQGGIMLMALIILLLLEVLGTASIEIGLMEYRSSHYCREEQQAQQAADAGVEWGIERVYLELQHPDNLSSTSLPEQLNCGNTELSVAGDVEACRVSIGEVVKTTNLVNEPGSCIYEFTSRGTYRGTSKGLAVQIVYYFTGGYQYLNADGQPSFMPRQYINRGKIVNYNRSI